MLYLIFEFDLCLILFHLKYSFEDLSLKSADKSISTLWGSNFFEIFCASPFGNAVNIILTSFKFV